MSDRTRPGAEPAAPYGGGAAGCVPNARRAPVKRIRTHHLREMKERGEKFAMLTAYDMYTAATFDEAGIEVLLVGDSASNNVLGNDTSLPVTVDELLPLTRAVRGRPGVRWSSATCRSGPTSARPSRPTTPPCGS